MEISLIKNLDKFFFKVIIILNKNKTCYSERRRWINGGNV